MGSKPARVRRYVRLTAAWGNGEVESAIKVSRRRWQAIQAGAVYAAASWSWYEGRRFRVLWAFSGGQVSVDGEDGRQCILGLPVSKLFVELPAGP